MSKNASANQENKKSWTILGQDPDILLAVWGNILSWLVYTFAPSHSHRLLPKYDEEYVSETCEHRNDKSLTRCVSIGRPGGLEQLRVVTLKEGIYTVGYNVKHFCMPPFTPNLNLPENVIPSDCVILQNEAFSVNYADCTIRWGLYESAKKFVGWPIVPGFDIAGIIQSHSNIKSKAGKTNVEERSSRGRLEFEEGDRVFGCTLFGSYSSHVLVPSIQLRKIPKNLSFAQAASLPAVSLTALHALSLAGHYPLPSKYTNKAILIHSAAGGVGGMLVQMAKILGLSPIVGVVGSSKKISHAKALGCDVVIDKSECTTSASLWTLIEKASPNGYSTVMDANGVSTLQESYNHLTPTGRLIIFGFHSNLPMGQALLSPKQWFRMIKGLGKMPTFDPMDLTVSNKSVLGFNLSFFSEEKEVCSDLLDQVCSWVEQGRLKCPSITEMRINDIGEAHKLIQSGQSVGKIVITT